MHKLYMVLLRHLHGVLEMFLSIKKKKCEYYHLFVYDGDELSFYILRARRERDKSVPIIHIGSRTNGRLSFEHLATEIKIFKNKNDYDY